LALPKNKSRKIVVDDINYRYAVSVKWKIDCNYDYDLNITVQSESNCAKLIINGMATRDFWLDVSSAPDDFSFYKVVTPKHVERFIKIGLGKGWQPSVKGKPFYLKASNEDVGDIRQA